MGRRLGKVREEEKGDEEKGNIVKRNTVSKKGT